MLNRRNLLLIPGLLFFKSKQNIIKKEFNLPKYCSVSIVNDNGLFESVEMFSDFENMESAMISYMKKNNKKYLYIFNCNNTKGMYASNQNNITISTRHTNFFEIRNSKNELLLSVGRNK